MNQDKSDVLFSLLSIWGIILFMIFFSLVGKAGAYEDYARERAAESVAVAYESGQDAFADEEPVAIMDDQDQNGAKLAEDPNPAMEARNAEVEPLTTRQKVGASVIVAVGATVLTACGVTGSRKMREKQR